MKDNLVFAKKKGGSNCSKAFDVSITYIHKNNKVAFSFSKRALAMMMSPQFLTAGTVGSRMYFKNADKVMGFKLCGKETTSRASISIAKNALGITSENFVGYYNLDYDTVRTLFYVDLNEKL